MKGIFSLNGEFLGQMKGILGPNEREFWGKIKGTLGAH